MNRPWRPGTWLPWIWLASLLLVGSLLWKHGRPKTAITYEVLLQFPLGLERYHRGPHGAYPRTWTPLPLPMPAAPLWIGKDAPAMPLSPSTQEPSPAPQP